tara:strand:- start:381 stop:866 length:486 start_codon:yes stop_codon:yes gene_type:complete
MASEKEKDKKLSNYDQGKVQDPNDINLIPNNPAQAGGQPPEDNNPQQSGGKNSSIFQNKTDVGPDPFESIKLPGSLSGESGLKDFNAEYQDNDLGVFFGQENNQDIQVSAVEEDRPIRTVGDNSINLNASDDPISGTIGVVICVNGRPHSASLYGQIGPAL